MSGVSLETPSGSQIRLETEEGLSLSLSLFLSLSLRQLKLSKETYINVKRDLH